jgi:hypothetical protein
MHFPAPFALPLSNRSFEIINVKKICYHRNFTGDLAEEVVEEAVEETGGFCVSSLIVKGESMETSDFLVALNLSYGSCCTMFTLAFVVAIN